jgi:proline iminopeptidase
MRGGSPLVTIDDRPSYPLAELLELPDGRLVEWEAVGSGPPLLWIEGGPGLPAHLARPDVGLLADRFRAHLVNAPGCGRSSPPVAPDGYGLEEHVAWFDGARRTLGLGRVTLMGHSWGGLVAVALAVRVPEAVERLILIDAYLGDASVHESIAAAERDRAFDRIRSEPWFETAVEAFERDLPSTARELDEEFEPCWPLYFASPRSAVAQDHIGRLRRETRWNLDACRAWTPEPTIDLRSELPAVRCPTLVIVGEHDFICGPAWNRPIADGIAGSTYAEIAGVGHMPQYEAPDEFRRVVLEWLGSSSPGDEALAVSRSQPSGP